MTTTEEVKPKKTHYINSLVYYRENFSKCHYCRSLNAIYTKFHSSDDTGNTWIKLAVPFTSCQNEDCPYHFTLREGIIQLAKEKIRWERAAVSSFF